MQQQKQVGYEVSKISRRSKRRAAKKEGKNSVRYTTTKAKIANRAEMSYSHDRQIAH